MTKTNTESHENGTEDISLLEDLGLERETKELLQGVREYGIIIPTNGEFRNERQGDGRSS